MSARLMLFLLCFTLSSVGLSDTIVIQLSSTEGLLVESLGPITTKRVPIQQVGSVVNPPPVSDSTRVERLRAVAGTEKTKQVLGGVALAIAKEIRSGSFTTQQKLEETYQKMLDFVLASQPDANVIRQAVEKEWVSVAQEGGQFSDYASLLDDVATAFNGQSLEAINIQVIAELIQLVMDPNPTPQTFTRIVLLVIQLFQ